MIKKEKLTLLMLLLHIMLFSVSVRAQNYNNILNYVNPGIPQYGVKIKTNLPFTPGSQMPTINISGYNYGGSESINLTINYYIYSDPNDWLNSSKFYFHLPSISSAGGYTPLVKLANEGGKVVIFLQDQSYNQHFTISAFALAMNEDSAWFTGWTAVNEPLGGTKITEIPYKNRFSGDVYCAGSSIWNTNGSIGIGTLTPTEKLSVNGKIRAKEIKVEATNWPDYVFEADYKNLGLAELDAYIKKNKHLPEVPSAKEIEANGVELGELNKLLLKKLEELTLHLIEKDKVLSTVLLRLEILEKNKSK